MDESTRAVVEVAKAGAEAQMAAAAAFKDVADSVRESTSVQRAMMEKNEADHSRLEAKLEAVEATQGDREDKLASALSDLSESISRSTESKVARVASWVTSNKGVAAAAAALVVLGMVFAYLTVRDANPDVIRSLKVRVSTPVDPAAATETEPAVVPQSHRVTGPM